MINKNDIIKNLQENGKALGIKIENGSIYNRIGTYLCTIDEYVEAFKLKEGCSFKSIYYNHAFLENVIKCNKCGTVIITKEDEDFDPNFRCPICTNYKTHFPYYIKEQIETDKNIKSIIDYYEKLAKFEKEAYEYEKEHGHPYWEILKKKIYTKNHMYTFELRCDDIRKSFFKGLQLIISSFNKTYPDTYVLKNNKLIPLSFYGMYIHWIYPHLGICHKDFRSKWYIGKAIENRNKKLEE